MMRRDLAAATARPCPRCYLIPHLHAGHADPPTAAALVHRRWGAEN
jgi:hypothetical protein